MWLLWIIGGWIQVASKRYFISNWTTADVIHAFVGTVICVLTFWNCAALFVVYGFLPSLHSIAGMCCLLAIAALFGTGWLTSLLTRYHKEKIWAENENWRIAAMAHKIIAYVTLVLCALVCSGGIGTYALLFLDDEFLYKFAFYNFYAVCGMSFISELVYRCWRKDMVKTNYDLNFKINTVVTVEEF